MYNENFVFAHPCNVPDNTSGDFNLVNEHFKDHQIKCMPFITGSHAYRLQSYHQ